MGVSTYTLSLRSVSGRGASSDTCGPPAAAATRPDSGVGALVTGVVVVGTNVVAGGLRRGASGAVSGAGALMMGARGRCARGKDVGPPW